MRHLAKVYLSHVRQNSGSPESLYLYALHFSPTGLQNGVSSLEPSVLDLWQSGPSTAACSRSVPAGLLRYGIASMGRCHVAFLNTYKIP